MHASLQGFYFFAYWFEIVSTLCIIFSPLYIVAPQFMWCCTFRVTFFTWLALPSGAAVQSLWGATSGGWHLWLWRQYQRGVVRPMDAAWSLLPIYEESQRQAKHCKKKTRFIFTSFRVCCSVLTVFLCPCPTASGALHIWTEGPGSNEECIEPSLLTSPIPLHTLPSRAHLSWHCGPPSIHGVCLPLSLSPVVPHKFSDPATCVQFLRHYLLSIASP